LALKRKENEAFMGYMEKAISYNEYLVNKERF
jgi:hypothetical protein